jgi:hypothetical protein
MHSRLRNSTGGTRCCPRPAAVDDGKRNGSRNRNRSGKRNPQRSAKHNNGSRIRRWRGAGGGKCVEPFPAVDYRVPVIYQHPLAYLLGIEGMAPLRAWAGDHGREFVEARLAEVRRLLGDEPLVHHGGGRRATRG